MKRYALHDIAINPQFIKAWIAANEFIRSFVDWNPDFIRAYPYQPLVDHVSFRVANQLFFVLLDVPGIYVPSDDGIRLLRILAKNAKGIACLMPMKVISPDHFVPRHQGWGLVDTESRKTIHPPDFVTEEKIEITDWELHQLSVFQLYSQLRVDKVNIHSVCHYPGIDPSIWYGSEENPQYLVVRGVRYPLKEAPLPSDIRVTKIVTEDGYLSKYGYVKMNGHFASVRFALVENLKPENEGKVIPLWRGEPLDWKTTGIKPL